MEGQSTTLKNMEIKMIQLATLVPRQIQGALPSNTGKRIQRNTSKSSPCVQVNILKIYMLIDKVIFRLEHLISKGEDQEMTHEPPKE